MPQSLPATSRARSHSATVPRAVRTFQTSPDCSPYLVRTQPRSLEDFRTKSTGEGATSPHPGIFTSNLEPRPLNLPSSPLPLSVIFMDNVVGCAWPDRTSFRKKIQDGQQGPQALCRGVSGGRVHNLPHTTSCLPAEVAGHFRSIGEPQCAKSLPCSVRPAKTGTTPPRRTRRRPPAASSSQSSATPAASTRRTKRRSKSTLGIQPSATSLQPTAPGGVSSTVKLSVSKTELLGSNPSSPASFPA
jgi:hypothetical protein